MENLRKKLRHKSNWFNVWSSIYLEDINILKKLDEVYSELRKKTEKLGKKTDVCEALEIMLKFVTISIKIISLTMKNAIWKNKY